MTWFRPSPGVLGWTGPALAALVWFGFAAAALAAEPGGATDYTGACSLTAAGGETLFAGDCAISHRPAPPAAAEDRCAYQRYEVLFPGVGLAVVERGNDPECPPRFQDRPAAFLARDRRGQLVLATAEGALVRFAPSPAEPPAPAPVLDDLLRGIETCRPGPEYRALTRSLRQAAASASEAIGAIPWPAGNPPPGQPLRLRQSGAWQQIDVPLRGRYLGLPLAGLRLETETGTGQQRDTLFFAGAPGRLVCTGLD
ncbi:hypothetical protein H9N28_08460 [Rhodobacter capsulatus]|uniref:hypothetical protein n=1 Tax=Rhodobacter capsulatus TaxID=1061 RepID=UPI000A588135|nr:hypothetical protein [Rhodobacter capsulatus]PZX23331.1 hypothetical protein LY44_02631 [Rhodobacter capsulatus]QNR64822.1 hypothetical protein H9N28_08460 [Rhodobacter capsulatus]